MYWVSPFGERREDMRAGYHTAHLIAAQAAKEISDSEFNEMIEHLVSYLACDKDTEDEVDMEALSRMKGKL